MDIPNHRFQVQEISRISRELALQSYLNVFEVLLSGERLPDLDWLRHTSPSTRAQIYRQYDPNFEEMALSTYISANEGRFTVIRWQSQAVAHLQDPNLGNLVEHVLSEDMEFLVSLDPTSPGFEAAVRQQILKCRFDDHPSLLNWLFAVAGQPLPDIADKEGVLEFLHSFLLARRQDGTGSCCVAMSITL